MLPEELLKGGQQPVHVQTMIRINIPFLLLDNSVLSRGGQFPGDDLPVDAVGDPHLRLPLNQTEILQILKIICGQPEPGLRTRASWSLSAS